MQNIYKSLGFTEINRLGLQFDPNLEDAIGTENTTSGVPGTVCQVVQKGYMFDDKLFRVAQVIVIPE